MGLKHKKLTFVRKSYGNIIEKNECFHLVFILIRISLFVWKTDVQHLRKRIAVERKIRQPSFELVPHR